MRTQDIAPSPEGKNVTMGAYVRDVFLEQVLPVLPTHSAGRWGAHGGWEGTCRCLTAALDGWNRLVTLSRRGVGPRGAPVTALLPLQPPRVGRLSLSHDPAEAPAGCAVGHLA